jgi:hypothetical protein
MAGPAFELRALTIPPGGAHPYRAGEWRDALVTVESGEVELECLGGSRRAFRSGAVLWLAGLPLRGLNNRGSEPALLVAVARADGTD